MRKFFLRGLIFLLAGCTVGPDYDAPKLEAPATWHNAETTLQNPIAQSWWQHLKDPILEKLIQETLEANPSLMGAYDNIQAAQATATEIGAPLFPTVNLTAAYNKNNAFNSLYSPAYGTYLNTSWEIDLFGTLRRAKESAVAQAEASVEQMRGMTLHLASEVANYYIYFRSAQQQKGVLEETVRLNQELCHLSAQRAQAGVENYQALETAAAALETAKAALTTANVAIKTALHHLAILQGKPPAHLYYLQETPGELPKISESFLVGLPGDLLKNRPDLREAERNLASSSALIGVAKGGFFPQFAFTGSVGYSSATRGSTLFKSSNFYYSVGPSLSWTLLDFGAVRAQMDHAEAQNDAALHAYQELFLKALEEVENTLVELKEEDKKGSALKQALSHDVVGSQLAMEKYKGGQTSFKEVVNAEIQGLTDVGKVVDHEARKLLLLVQLYKALGGSI